jgi:rhamnogalacturonan endolyase
MTGREIDRVDWVDRGNIDDWGDPRHNRAARHLIGAAYLDGKRPSLLVLRGTYTLMRVDAYNLEGGKLKQIWSWSGDDENPPVRGQGMHGMLAADVTGDGCDEIILGGGRLEGGRDAAVESWAWASGCVLCGGYSAGQPGWRLSTGLSRGGIRMRYVWLRPARAR